VLATTRRGIAGLSAPCAAGFLPLLPPASSAPRPHSSPPERCRRDPSRSAGITADPGTLPEELNRRPQHRGYGTGRPCCRGQTRAGRPNRSARPVRRCRLVLNMAPTAGLGHVGVLYYTPDASEVSCTNTGVLFAVKPRRLGRSGLQLKMYR